MKRLLVSILIIVSTCLFADTMFNKEYKMITLDNGLIVVMVKSDKQPIVTIAISARNGAYTQSESNCGLSHLYEHMFFKGNKKWRSQEDYSKRIRELGIIYNGVTSNESVRYYFTLPSAKINEGLEFMKYAIREPLFDTTELRKEKSVVMNEFKRDFSEPRYIFYQATEQAMFEKYFYRKNAIGEKEIILEATQDQMLDIQKIFYIPNNCALVIVGDIDFKNTEKLVKKYFSDWEKGKAPNFDFPQHPMLEKDKKIIIKADVNISNLSIQFRGPDVDDNREDTYPLDLLTEMMRMKSFTLRKKLVDTGLVYDFYAGYYTQQDGGTFTFHSVLLPENVEKVKEIILSEIDIMTDPSYYNKEVIEEAKERSEINFLYNVESTEDFALNIGFWWCISDMKYFHEYLDNIKKVDSKSISEIVKKYLYNKKRVIAVLTNEEASKKYFDKSWKENGL